MEIHDCSYNDRIEDTLYWAVTITNIVAIILDTYIYIRNEAEITYNILSIHLVEIVHQTGATLNVMILIRKTSKH